MQIKLRLIAVPSRLLQWSELLTVPELSGEMVAHRAAELGFVGKIYAAPSKDEILNGEWILRREIEALFLWRGKSEAEADRLAQSIVTHIKGGYYGLGG